MNNSRPAFAAAILLACVDVSCGANVADGMHTSMDAVMSETSVAVVQNPPGYNSWPMIQAVGSRLVCAYSRGSAHTIDEGARGVYARFSDEQPYTSWLHPYFVKVFSQRWYVIGPTGRHPRTPHVYALDRVLSLRETSGRFEYPSGFDPQAFFADSYGIFHGTEPAVTVVIRAGERQAKFMRSLPLHASQQEISETEAAGIAGEGFAGTGSDSGSDSGRAAADGTAYFALRLVPTLDFIQYLLSQGAELEVLAPASLRDDLSRRASAIARLYR